MVSARTAGVLEVVSVPATPEGYEQLWGLCPGSRRAWSVEGTANYGPGLTRFLQRRGERAVEMDHPNRTKRRNGVKNDEVDAARAAREALGRDELAQPRGGGEWAALAVLAAKQARTQFQSLVVSGPDELRGPSRG